MADERQSKLEVPEIYANSAQDIQLREIGQTFHQLLSPLNTVEQIILFMEEGYVNIWTVTDHLSGEEADAIYRRELDLHREFPGEKLHFRLIQLRGRPLRHFLTPQEGHLVIKLSEVNSSA